MPTGTVEYGDDFDRYCADNGFTSEDERQRAFPVWIEDTTGWDGTQFSLSESERHWIKNAKEVLDWLGTYGVTGQDEMLHAALRALGSVPPFPGSFTIE
jgi:hypothetical protein